MTINSTAFQILEQQIARAGVHKDLPAIAGNRPALLPQNDGTKDRKTTSIKLRFWIGAADQQQDQQRYKIGPCHRCNVSV